MLAVRFLMIAIAAWSCGMISAKAAPGCPDRRFDVLTPLSNPTPFVVLNAGGRTGPWLLDFGSTITATYADGWAIPEPGEAARLFSFSLLSTVTAPRELPIVPGGRSRAGVGLPLGVLGTDVLKTVTTEIHFEDGSDPHVILRDPACDNGPVGGARIRRVGQAGFFGAHPEMHRSNLPNVPVVFVELEQRSTDLERPRLVDPKRSPRTWAQLDTGYADTYWPFSVDINEAYLAELKRTVPSLAVAGLVPVAGCGGEDTVREVYVAPGWKLNVVPDIPQRPIAFDSFSLIVKPKTTECGGIGPMTVPAAQLGASFLKAFGTTILMPSRSELWIRLPAPN